MNKSMKRSMINNNVWYKSMLVGNEAYSPPDYELISTVFGNGSSGTIEFSSIPQTYKHLQIRYTARNATQTNRLMLMRFNDVATTSYATHYIRGTGTNVISSAFTSETSITIREGIAASNEGAGSHVAAIIDTLDYQSTSKNTTIRGLYGQQVNQHVTLSSGFIDNTSLITKISFIVFSGAFTTTTRFSLYGIKG